MPAPPCSSPYATRQITWSRFYPRCFAAMQQRSRSRPAKVQARQPLASSRVDVSRRDRVFLDDPELSQPRLEHRRNLHRALVAEVSGIFVIVIGERQLPP